MQWRKAGRNFKRGLYVGVITSMFFFLGGAFVEEVSISPLSCRKGLCSSEYYSCTLQHNKGVATDTKPSDGRWHLLIVFHLLGVTLPFAVPSSHSKG